MLHGVSGVASYMVVFSALVFSSLSFPASLDWDYNRRYLVEDDCERKSFDTNNLLWLLLSGVYWLFKVSLLLIIIIGVGWCGGAVWFGNLIMLWRTLYFS